jgi:hypothetical protein
MKMFFVTHVWKILLALAFCAMFVLGVQFLRIARYEYRGPEKGSGEYLLRINRLHGSICWIATDEQTRVAMHSQSNLPECK